MIDFEFLFLNGILDKKSLKDPITGKRRFLFIPDKGVLKWFY
jgi:hypothetical protein